MVSLEAANLLTLRQKNLQIGSWVELVEPKLVEAGGLMGSLEEVEGLVGP